MEKEDTLECCAVCYSDKFDYEIINNKRICKNNTCWMQPTCKELFTETYLCDFCNTTKNVNECKCHIFYYEEIDMLYKYICNDCYDKYELQQYSKFHGINTAKKEKWLFVNETDLLNKIIENYDILELPK